mgnify:CR=1 FL=1
MTIVVLFSIVCLSIGVTLAKRMVVGNSAILLCNFAKETGKNISNIINLEIQKLEMLANTPILQDRNADEEKKMEYLRKIAEKYGYTKAGLIDLDGNCKTTTGKEANISELEYFAVNMEGKSYLSKPFKSILDGEWQIAISTPLYDGLEMIGILLFTKDAESFCNITNRITFGKTGTAYVVDEKGTNIINRDIYKVINKVNRIEDSKTKPEYRELAQITQKMIAGESGTGHYTLNGKRKFIGYAPVQGKGWAVGVTVEIQDMLSGLNQIVIYMSVFTVLVLICMMYVTRNIANNFSNRLSEVQNELNQIAKGDFTLNKKKYSIIDEIAELDCTLQQTKESLNDMIEKIQATHEKKKEKLKQVEENKSDGSC